MDAVDMMTAVETAQSVLNGQVIDDTANMPPGGVTDATPGMSDRVRAIIARRRDGCEEADRG